MCIGLTATVDSTWTWSRRSGVIERLARGAGRGAWRDTFHVIFQLLLLRSLGGFRGRGHWMGQQRMVLKAEELGYKVRNEGEILEIDLFRYAGTTQMWVLPEQQCIRLCGRKKGWEREGGEGGIYRPNGAGDLKGNMHVWVTALHGAWYEMFSIRCHTMPHDAVDPDLALSGKMPRMAYTQDFTILTISAHIPIYLLDAHINITDCDSRSHD